MIHIVSNEKNSYDLLTYDHDSSADYSAFFEGAALGGSGGSLNYQVNKKSDIRKLRHFHLIRSTGPDLVSNELRTIT